MTTTKHTEEIEFVAKGARQAERDLDGVGESYNSLGMAAMAAAKRVGISEDQINKATKAFAALAPGIGAATAAWAALQKTIELGTIGAKISDLEGAVSRLGTTEGDLRQLGNTLAGTVSRADILRFNNMARTLGLTQEQFQKATEVSKAAAGVLGIDVKFALESVSTGLARQSKLWLDNLGIIIDTDKANREYAATLGKTASQLTEAQRRQAFFNGFVEAGNRLIEKGGARQADVFERWAADFDNITDAGLRFIAAIAGKGLTAVDDMTGRTQELADAADPTAAAFRKASEAASDAANNFRRAQLALKAAGSVTRAEAQRILDEATKEFNESQVALREASNAVAFQQEKYAERFKDGWVDAFKGVQGAVDETIRRFERLNAVDSLPEFVKKFGIGVADPDEARRQADARARAAAAARARRARLAETREYFQGGGLRRDLGPLLESDPEERIFQATRQAPGDVAAVAPFDALGAAAADRRDALDFEREFQSAQLQTIGLISAQAAAFARLGSEVTATGIQVREFSAIMSVQALGAVGQIGDAFGQAAVAAIFAGESFSTALGNALIAAGAQTIGQAISGLAVAGILAFIPGLQGNAAGLAAASSAALVAGTALVGVGKSMGGNLNPGVGADAPGTGAPGRAAQAEERDRQRDFRRSRTGADQQEVTIIINNSLGGERVDRAIHRAATRGARFDRPRRAGAM